MFLVVVSGGRGGCGGVVGGRVCSAGDADGCGGNVYGGAGFLFTLLRSRGLIRGNGSMMMI